MRLTKNDMQAGKIPFIGATDSNNGITAWISNKNSSLDKNVLGVNYNGSVVENFYHPYAAIFSDDVKRLHLINHADDKYVLLFIKNLILQQKKKFQYGYKFNAGRMERQKINLPINELGEPDWLYMENYMRRIEDKLLKIYLNYITPPQVDDEVIVPADQKVWKAFYLTEIFSNIKRGKRLKTDDHIAGKVPYISSSANNNGVDNFIEFLIIV